MRILQKATYGLLLDCFQVKIRARNIKIFWSLSEPSTFGKPSILMMLRVETIVCRVQLFVEHVLIFANALNMKNISKSIKKNGTRNVEAIWFENYKNFNITDDNTSSTKHCGINMRIETISFENYNWFWWLSTSINDNDKHALGHFCLSKTFIPTQSSATGFGLTRGTFPRKIRPDVGNCRILRRSV